MTRVWRLVTHHERKGALLDWCKTVGAVSIGWSRIGEVDPKDSPDTIRLKVKAAYAADGIPLPNWAVSGKQLYAFVHEMKPGDLVILSTGVRRCVMRVTGGYEFSEEWQPNEDLYGHRRAAQLVNLNADEVWRRAGGRAPGQRVRNALIRCANEVDL